MHDMGTEKRKGRGDISRAAILAAIWTLIAVTLLSALAPLGPPSSRLKGSAFNPATTEVVLKTRARGTTQMVQLVRPDGGDLPPVALLCLALALLVCLARMRPGAPVPVAAQRLTRLHLFRAHRARAPPAAF